VEHGQDLNQAQIYFLLMTDPLQTREEAQISRGEHRIFNELATGMPVEVAKEQLKKIMIEYDGTKPD